MITPVQISIVIVCLLFLAVVIRQVSAGKMLLKYSLLWMALAIVLALVCLFPEPVYAIARLAGFEIPSNGLFVAAIFFLVAVCVSLTIIVSRQSSRIKSLVQHQALLEARVDALERERTTGGPDARPHAWEDATACGCAHPRAEATPDAAQRWE